MKTYPSPKRSLVNAKPADILDKLVERYRSNNIEAAGLLHTIAEHYTGTNNDRDYDIVNFLRKVGSESSPQWEPRDDLRTTARRLIYRQLMLKAMQDVRLGWPIAVHEMISLLDAEENCPRIESDRGIVRAFLGRCWKFYEQYQTPRYSHLINASICTGYLDHLKASQEDINSLHWYLRSKLPESERDDIEENACVLDEPIGEGNTAISELTLLLAGRIFDSNLSDLYGAHAAKLLSLRAEWLVREGKYHS